MSKFGLIGVGLLGTAIAERLLEAGHSVEAFDVRETQRRRIQQQGAVARSTALEVIQVCDTIILSLPNSQVVRELLQENEDGLKHQVFIDTTTGAPEDAATISRWLSERGATYIEANVAGSSVQQRAGEATLFLGGDEATIHAVRGALDALSPRHFYLGPVGAASRFKLVHNLILGLHRAVLAEGLSLAEALGFDLDVALEVLKTTPAASAVMDTKGARMASGEYPVQARLAQHLKDVRLILNTADTAGAYTPLSQLHETLLNQAETLGLGDCDNSAIMEVFRNGKRLGE